MAGYNVAVDFGGTNIRAALVKDLKIIKIVKKETRASKGKNFVISQLIKTIEEAKNKKKINGIGIGSPGPLKNGIIKNPPNLPLKNVNLKKIIQKRFKVRTIIENDAKCAALAEAKLGTKKKNFILLTIGTGIGGGIVINHKLYKGTGYAGELGHMMIQDHKDLEDLASGKAIRKVTKKYLHHEIKAKDLIKIKSKKARFILQNEIKYLSIGIANLINVFDPDVVILTGGVREIGNSFLKKVRKEVQKYTIIPRKVDIRWSKIKEPGILGAALLLRWNIKFINIQIIKILTWTPVIYTGRWTSFFS